VPVLSWCGRATFLQLCAPSNRIGRVTDGSPRIGTLLGCFESGRPLGGRASISPRSEHLGCRAVSGSRSVGSPASGGGPQWRGHRVPTPLGGREPDSRGHGQGGAVGRWHAALGPWLQLAGAHPPGRQPRRLRLWRSRRQHRPGRPGKAVCATRVSLAVERVQRADAARCYRGQVLLSG